MTDKSVPDTAMVLAAGLGKRMRPLTETRPKPLIEVGGKALIDWSLDLLADAGVAHAVVNIHHLGDQIQSHVQTRRQPRISISDETGCLLDSAGGIINALPMLGSWPFFALNADTFWIDGGSSNLLRMASEWDPARMDILMLLSRLDTATGHSGTTDFLIDNDGKLSRANGAHNGLIYAGALIADPSLFDGAAAEPQSLNRYFDAAIARGRLHGIVLDGSWITVGTPEAIAPAEAAIAAAVSLQQ